MFMSRFFFQTRQSWLAVVALLSAVVMCGWTVVASATDLTLKDGRVLEGRVGQVTKLGGTPLKPNSPETDAAQIITMVDDDLRRTFVSYYSLQGVGEPGGPNKNRANAIKIPQRVASGGGVQIGSVGQFIKIGPWDEFGRRTVVMASGKGPITIVQGITEITPLYARVQGLHTSNVAPYVWDMRIAMGSIPRDDLRKILQNMQKGNNAKDPEDYRAKIVRLYMFAGMYFEADQELQELLKVAKTPEDYSDFAKELKGLKTNLLLKELEQRSNAGQHQFSWSMLNAFTNPKFNDPKFPIPGEVLQKVNAMLQGYEAEKTRGENIIKELDVQLALVVDSPTRKRFEPAVKQIKDELNYNTLDRLTSFYRLRDAANIPPERKLALAISGWVLGSNAAADDSDLALSSLDIRELMRQYLREPMPLKRGDLLKQLNSQPGFTAERCAKIADFMKPPLDMPANPAGPGNVNGFYELTIPGIDKEPDVTYCVQLPPEYDPYRRYPTIIALHGNGTSAEQELDWWAGTPVADKMGVRTRQGQAVRQGYIVISPAWLKPNQAGYEASAYEHYTVTGTLRDACRRFSIDTDRVYLSGHSLGGNAAWDIGVAHPDLWAGVIPIVSAMDEKTFVAHYTQNAKNLPMYFVFGELDADKLQRSAFHFDRYMRAAKFDTTVVEYLGRGHEDFSDEIQRLFDWMGRKKRDFTRKEFEVTTMRTWDNYFWWLEIDIFPGENAVEPVNGAPPTKPKPTPLNVKGWVNAVNNVSVSAGKATVTVWLSPELVDLNKPVSVNLNGRTVRAPPASGETVLEDIRTRGDRRHPFWVKVSQ